MKKNYFTLFCALMAASSLSAQTTFMVKDTKKSEKAELATDVRPGKVIYQGMPKAAGDTIWRDYFNTPGDWTADAPAGTPSGPDYGWTITNTIDTWAFGATATFNSTSGGNFGHFENGDPTATPSTEHNDGPFTLTYNNTIDLSGVPAPHLEFEQYGAIFFEIQAVQVSTNGGSSWTTVIDNSDITPLTAGGGSAFDNPMTRRVNITAAIASDPSNVSVRFFWDAGTNGGSPSYVTYGWFVDDIRILEGYQNDLTANSINMASGLGYSYSMVPDEQITTINFGGQVTNNGGAAQTNTMLNVDVVGDGFSGSSAGVTLNVGTTDSLEVNGYTPSGIGAYTVRAYVSSDNSPLDFPSDDTLTRDFEVTNNIYATDYGTTATGSFSGWSGSTGGPEGIGNFYEIFADDMLYGVDVALADGANDDNLSNLYYVELRKFDANAGEYIYVDQTVDQTLTAGDQGQTVTVKFNSPIQVTAGEELFVVFYHYGSPVAVEMRGRALENTVAGYNDQGQLVGLIDPDYPVVRLNFDEVLSVEEEVANETFTIGQNVPNPFNNSSYINYSLEESNDVSFTVVDMTGKTVMNIDKGTQAAGQHRIDLDATNFAEGVYFYTFTVGNKKVTKKMVIASK